MQDIARDGMHGKGWSVDADSKNDPTYPIRHRLGADEERAPRPRPAQQPVDIEVLRSIERPAVTAVFGTSTPPAGLSGAIRRVAFKYSESSYLHWLPLVLADRIGVVEGVIDDLRRGRVPNVFAEAGWRAQWRHDRPRFVGGLILRGALLAAAVGYTRGRRGAQNSLRDEGLLRFTSEPTHRADALATGEVMRPSDT